MDVTQFLQQTINAVSLGAIYALFALGYAVVFSILGVLNLAHSAIFMWGAFIGLLALTPDTAPILLAFMTATLILSLPYWLFERHIATRLYDELGGVPGARPFIMLVVRSLVLWVAWQVGGVIYGVTVTSLSAEIQIAPIVALVLAMLGGGVISVLLEFVAFRPLRERNAARLAQLISSIGAALVLVNLAQFAFQAVFGITEAYYPRNLSIVPFIGSDPIRMGDLIVQPIRVVILVIALALMILLQYMVTQTRIGQQMRAVAFNRQIASLLGIDVSQVYVLTFFLAGIFGGAAGMLFGMVFLQVTPFIGESIALVGLTAIVLGGLGTIQGAVLGGFIVAALQTASVALGGSNYRNAVVFILLFVLLLVRPQGLLGQPEQNRA
jgi:branched-chain amino acid transport system permease protein